MIEKIWHKPVTILMADDDPDDRLLAGEAMEESDLANELSFVEDGVELMDYLRGEGKFAENPPPRPGVILLDLNMPRINGREALVELKSDPKLRRIPVVILTTSKAQEDIIRSYDLGVNSFIVKPVTFEKLVDVMRAVGRYWFEIVELPN